MKKITFMGKKAEEVVGRNGGKRIRKLLAKAGLVSDSDICLYEEALTYSTSGFSIVLENSANCKKNHS